MATSSISSVLKDVVAYVDVWSKEKTANYSKPFIQQLQDMGAQVRKRFSNKVTHVVFSNGHPATWRKAKKSNVKLVSVLWVGRCHDDGVKVDEDLFPALNDSNSVLQAKRHRCMLPKDSPEKTPNNDKRMRKKLDKMMKDIPVQKPLDTDFSPIIIDEKNGIIYSPAFKRSDYMAQRLKDMKEKNENISHTGEESEMEESPSELEYLGGSRTVFKFPYDKSEDESSPSVAETGLSPAKEEGTSISGIERPRRVKPWKDEANKSYSEASEKQSQSPVMCLNLEENEADVEEPKSSRRISRRKSGKQKSTGSNNYIQLSDTLDQDTCSSKNTRRSSEKSRSSISRERKLSSGKCDSKQGMEITKGEEPQTKTQGAHKNVKSIISAAGCDLSVKTVEQTEQAPYFSELVQAVITPKESHKAACCSSNDDDDDVFEDYFSSGNVHPEPKRAFSSRSAANTFQLPFELEFDTKKRKPRRSVSTENEKARKNKKLEEFAIDVQDLNMEDSPECKQIDNKLLLSDLCSSRDNLKQPAKRRQSAISFSSISVTSIREKGGKRLSLSVQPSKSEETSTSMELHKKADSSLLLKCSSSTSRVNEDTDASDLTQSAPEEQNTDASTFQTMVHTTIKVGRTLVMTSMPTEKQNIVLQAVKALGGFTVVDEVCESTTHVVSGGHRRTLNILLGIARGCWILSFEWVCM